MPKFLHILSLLKGVKSVLGPSLALLAKDSLQKKCMVSQGFEPAIPSMAGRAAIHWATLPVAGYQPILMSFYLLALKTSIQLLRPIVHEGTRNDLYPRRRPRATFLGLTFAITSTCIVNPHEFYIGPKEEKIFE